MKKGKRKDRTKVFRGEPSLYQGAILMGILAAFVLFGVNMIFQKDTMVRLNNGIMFAFVVVLAGIVFFYIRSVAKKSSIRCTKHAIRMEQGQKLVHVDKEEVEHVIVYMRTVDITEGYTFRLRDGKNKKIQLTHYTVEDKKAIQKEIQTMFPNQIESKRSYSFLRTFFVMSIVLFTLLLAAAALVELLLKK